MFSLHHTWRSVLLRHYFFHSWERTVTWSHWRGRICFLDRPILLKVALYSLSLSLSARCFSKGRHFKLERSRSASLDSRSKERCWGYRYMWETKLRKNLRVVFQETRKFEHPTTLSLMLLVESPLISIWNDTNPTLFWMIFHRGASDEVLDPYLAWFWAL